MTEQSPLDFHNSKIQTSTGETQKKKKSSKKKANEKASHVRTEGVEALTGGLNQEGNFDLLHYTMKLEQEVLTARKQLKNQRKKFREVIYGLAKHFDTKGINSEEIQEYIQGLGPQIAQNDELESNYEKFFTVNKYHVAEDSNNNIKHIPLSGYRIENIAKNSSTDIPKLNIGDTLHSSDNLNGKSEKDEKKKGGRKASKTMESNGDEVPKKRKYTKKNKQVEEEHKTQSVPEVEEIQEIPPFQVNKKESPTKSDANSNSKIRKAEDSIKSYEEIQTPKQFNDLDLLSKVGYMMNDNNLTAITQQMNPNTFMKYYMSHAGNYGGIQDGEFLNKYLQEYFGPNMAYNNNMMNTNDKGRKGMMDYFQGSFK